MEFAERIEELEAEIERLKYMKESRSSKTRTNVEMSRDMSGAGLDDDMESRSESPDSAMQKAM
jgi:hypothetical protein